MKRIASVALSLMLLTEAYAQCPTLSPKHQKVSWGEVAFTHDTPLCVEGAEHADADAMALLNSQLSHRFTPSAQGAVRLVIGEAGDKSVRPFRKMIPSQAEG